MQKLKTHLLRTRNSMVLPSKPGAGPYIAMHDTPILRDVLLANLCCSGPFECIFSKLLPSFSYVGCG